MKQILSFKLIAVLSLSLCCFALSAQPRLPKGLTRFQLGYSYPMAKAESRLVYPVVRGNDFTRYFVDTVIDRQVNTKFGFGATLGTYFPVANLSEQAQLAISLDGVFNILAWDYEAVNASYQVGGNSYSQEYVITGGTMQVGLPIGVDLKFGSDAALNKSVKACATFGVGAFPSAALTVYEEEADAVLKVQPYLKGEIGFFGGICWKFRAVYVPGKIDYINRSYVEETSVGSLNNSFLLRGKSSLTLSLILMPFSWGWERSDF